MIDDKITGTEYRPSRNYEGLGPTVGAISGAVGGVFWPRLLGGGNVGSSGGLLFPALLLGSIAGTAALGALAGYGIERWYRRK